MAGSRVVVAGAAALVVALLATLPFAAPSGAVGGTSVTTVCVSRCGATTTTTAPTNDTTTTTSPTTSTTAPPARSSGGGAGTTNGGESTAPPGGAGATTSASPSGSSAPSASQDPGGGDASPPSGAGTPVAGTGPVGPSFVAPFALSGGSVVVISGPDALLVGPRSTTDVLSLLGGLDVPPALLARVLAPFPVAGRATYSDDRRDSADIFADRGTPVIASGDGAVTRMDATALTLAAADGATYFYGHLDGAAPGVVVGRRVAKGDVLGFVGSAGDAAGSSHLHYEIRPKGAQAVPPVPYLDRWLAEARQAAQLLKGGSTGALSLLGSAPAIAAGAAAGDVPRAQAAAAASAVRTPGRGVGAAGAAAGVATLALLGLPLPLWWFVGRRDRRRLQLG